MTQEPETSSTGELFIATEQCLSSKVGEEHVILDTDTGTYYGLNSVGSYLWAQLEEAQTIDELVSKTAEKFGVSEVECREDVELFLSEMRQTGLVETA